MKTVFSVCDYEPICINLTGHGAMNFYYPVRIRRNFNETSLKWNDEFKWNCTLDRNSSSAKASFQSTQSAWIEKVVHSMSSIS